MYHDQGQTVFMPQPGIQGPAYDPYGRQVLFNMSYEQRMAHAHNMRRQYREYVQKKLKENYPKKFALVYSIIMVIIGLACIALQIVLIVNKTNMSNVGNGIWGGFICICLAVFSLVLIKYPKNSLLVFTLISHFFGIIIIIAALVLVNFIGLLENTSPFGLKDSSKKMIPVTGVMIGLGGVAFITCISFLVMIFVSIGRQPRTIQGANIYPNNLTASQNMNMIGSYQNNYAPAYNIQPPSIF